MGPPRLAATYRQRWRVAQAIEELKNGTARDHLVTYRLIPTRKAVAVRLLARTLALSYQIADAGARPAVRRAPAAFRAGHVLGLGTFAPLSHQPRALLVATPAAAHAPPPHAIHLPWTACSVSLTAWG